MLISSTRSAHIGVGPTQAHERIELLDAIRGVALGGILLAAARASVARPASPDWKADWSRAAVASNFVQAEPTQGEPASEATEVRVLFDARYLYIGVVCHDTNGDRDLRVRDLRRDFDDTTDDFFGVAIDGVRDGRSAMTTGSGYAFRSARYRAS